MHRSGFTVLLAASAFSVTLLVAGCHSNSIDGVYAMQGGGLSLKFEKGKAFLKMGPMQDSDGLPYDVKGDKVIIHNVPGGAGPSDLTLTRDKDGNLQSDLGLLTKQKGS